MIINNKNYIPLSYGTHPEFNIGDKFILVEKFLDLSVGDILTLTEKLPHNDMAVFQTKDNIRKNLHWYTLSLYEQVAAAKKGIKKITVDGKEYIPLRDESHPEYIPGNKFIVIDDNHPVFKLGTIITLAKNNNTKDPLFRCDDGEDFPCWWWRLAPYVKESVTTKITINGKEYTPLSNEPHTEFDRGDKFIVIDNDHSVFKFGNIITLAENDETEAPEFFWDEGQNITCWWNHLAPYVEKKKQTMKCPEPESKSITPLTPEEFTALCLMFAEYEKTIDKLSIIEQKLFEHEDKNKDAYIQARDLVHQLLGKGKYSKC